MATRKKEIKKPSFIITYAVCLLVSLIIVGGFCAAIGVSQYYLFYVRAWGNMVGLDADLTTEICNFLSTEKEDITREKIVWLKWVILEKGEDGKPHIFTERIPIERYPFKPEGWEEIAMAD